MSKLFWLASYPKSGNTWVRTLLTNYQRDADEPVDINALDSAGAFGVEQMNEWLGIDSSNLTEQEMLKYRRLVYEEMAREHTEPCFLKIHDAYIYDSENIPVFSEKATGGVIHIIRNPLDVAVSYAHHRNASIEKTIKSMNDEEHHLGNWRVNHGQVKQPALSWSNHAKSWKYQSKLKVLTIRYEDMLVDTIKEFTKIVKFAGLEFSKKRIAKAVDFSSFDKLKAQEKKSGFSEKQPTAESFFRKGKANSWRESLTDEQAKRIISDHQDVVERFGYLDELEEDLLK